MELLVKDSIFIDQRCTIDGMGDSNSKFAEVKSKNLVIFDFLTKSKLLVKSSFEMDFLTPETKLLFTKLR